MVVPGEGGISMSSNRRRRRRKENAADRERRPVWRRVALLITVVLIFSGVILANMGRSAKRGGGAQPLSGVNLVKQYIYAGGRLVSTKEP